jgi:hypothetical protein
MADQEHINILKQGMEAWNLWRDENTDTLPDLRGADLSTLHLIGYDFTGANFTGAKLVDTNFYGAKLASIGRVFRGSIVKLIVDFVGADLTRASLGNNDLAQADFTEANLEGANLADSKLLDANLNKANLNSTFLYRTNFNEARLSETSFHNARMLKTVFGDVDLSRAKGLETVSHEGPLVIGIETLYRSKGAIPEVFLRYAGVPDSMIEYIHSLVGKSIDYYSCFISYSHDDQAFAERLYTDLLYQGVRCWFAPEDLKIGDKIRSSIDEAIRIHDKLLLVLSKKSVESNWVEKEVETAFEKEYQQKKLVLFPIRLDDTVMETTQAWAADIRRTRYIGDFRNWKNQEDYQRVLNRLLHDLKA